ncbi:MAG: hypothetical protein ACLUMK_05920 [Christensenellales bacterium]
MQAILRAAIEAPTAGNMTLWSAIRVTMTRRRKSAFSKPATISRLSQPRRWCSCLRGLQALV